MEHAEDLKKGLAGETGGKETTGET